MFRLFGSKKERKDGQASPEGAGGSDHEEREAAEGFTELVPSRPAPGTPALPAGEGPPTYSSLQQQLPYQLPRQGTTPGGRHWQNVSSGVKICRSLERRGSEQHPLNGVTFTLSPRLTQDRELEYITAAVDSVLAKMGGIDWSAYEYSFGLEQSVLDNQAALPSVQQMAIED